MKSREKLKATHDYELWDLVAGNLMGAYPTEAAALAEVRVGIHEDGEAAWHDVGLRATDGKDGSRKIVMGDELIALALAAHEQTVTGN